MPVTKRREKQLQRMMSVDEVAQHFGVSVGTIYAMLRRGEFPRPERLGRRLVRWNADRLNEFIDAGCRI
jgi:excisionase family DNA binding protein